MNWALFNEAGILVWKDEDDSTELVKPFLWILAEYGFNYDDEINIVQETMRCFWNGTDLKLTDEGEVFYNF